jgi:N-acetylmuramoyl-L-alanine amidase
LNYQSAAFVAIYSGPCAESPLPLSGFKIATSLTAQNPDAAYALAVCLSETYGKLIKIPFTYEVLNPDHPSYHIFRDIDSQTPAVMIEAGSLKTDRTILVNQADSVAEGISEGILCFLNQSNGANQ